MEGGDRQTDPYRHTPRAICLGGRRKEEFGISQGEEREMLFSSSRLLLKVPSPYAHGESVACF